jgi:hypothetical protein
LHTFSSNHTICVFTGGNIQATLSNIPVDLPDALWLQSHFADYANPMAKINRLVRQGMLYRLKKGLYIKAESAHNPNILCKAANRLYGPSYVSFVYALRWHGLIPEYVANITSATYKKSRSKRYDTPVGSFLYQDIPQGAYPKGVVFAGEQQNRFLIASAEKALCDELYRISGIRSLTGIEELLFEDLRLDAGVFGGLDHNALIHMAATYKTVTLETFVKFLEKNRHAGS